MIILYFILFTDDLTTAITTSLHIRAVGLLVSSWCSSELSWNSKLGTVSQDSLVQNADKVSNLTPHSFSS